MNAVRGVIRCYIFQKRAIVQRLRLKIPKFSANMQPIVSKIMTNIAEGTVSFLVDFLADFTICLSGFSRMI